jgi:hypothetical protein
MVMLPEEEQGKIVLVPRETFVSLTLEAGKRFDDMAALAPYPEFMGVRWKANSTVYAWFVKRLRKVYEENFKNIVELELEEAR